MKHSIMGEEGLERWEDKPENRILNNGLGLCNTGSGRSLICCFGGIGCDVDHAWIAYGQHWRQGQETRARQPT